MRAFYLFVVMLLLAALGALEVVASRSVSTLPASVEVSAAVK